MEIREDTSKIFEINKIQNVNQKGEGGEKSTKQRTMTVHAKASGEVQGRECLK